LLLIAEDFLGGGDTFEFSLVDFFDSAVGFSWLHFAFLFDDFLVGFLGGELTDVSRLSVFKIFDLEPLVVATLDGAARFFLFTAVKT